MNIKRIIEDTDHHIMKEVVMEVRLICGLRSISVQPKLLLLVFDPRINIHWIPNGPVQTIILVEPKETHRTNSRKVHLAHVIIRVKQDC